MRTTLTIDDRIVKDLKDAAHRRGVSFKSMVNQVLSAGLMSIEEGRAEILAYESPVFAMGYPRGGLAKALQLAGELENEEVAREMALRK